MRLCAFALTTLLVSDAAGADWREIAPGIEYQETTIPGPVQVYMARADRTKKTWIIDTMVAKGTSRGARETVAGMAARYDDSVNFEGKRYDIKIAINGDYFPMNTGVPLGGQIIGGWFIRRFGEYGGGSGFMYKLDGRFGFGGNVHNASKYQVIRFADGAQMGIDKLNDPSEKNELGMYTWHYSPRTDASPEETVEVVAQMSAPVGIMPDDRGVPGRIVSVKRSHGETPLLYEQVILAGHGKAADELMKHAKAGQQLRIDLQLKEFGNEEFGKPPSDWKGAYSSMGAATYIVVNGKVPRHWEKKAAQYAKEGKKHGSVVQDPRTLIACNDRYVYFIIVDGRSKQSIGMTFTEAGNFCVEHLQATDAVTEDGGGSSTMWLDGEVRNNPSGKPGTDKAGQLRPVANGAFMALLLPAEKSKALAANRKVKAKGQFELRLGPGTQFAPTATMPADASGAVLPHKLDGIKAKGENWWNCRFGQTEGWAAEKSIIER